MNFLEDNYGVLKRSAKKFSIDDSHKRTVRRLSVIKEKSCTEIRQYVIPNVTRNRFCQILHENRNVEIFNALLDIRKPMLKPNQIRA